jgi:hypothetical protein
MLPDQPFSLQKNLSMNVDYFNDSLELRSLFDPDANEVRINGSEIRIVNPWFRSDFAIESFSSAEDAGISENMSFRYPVFIPAKKDSKKVILLLHGLNERSWIKYLTWGYRLSEDTGSYVILFPISFHVNRSPGSWIDPRRMTGFLRERRDKYENIEMSSFANIVLSNRLTGEPMRFFSSGYQTASDLIKLLSQIKDGRHDIIPAASMVDIFAYSIGAFLGQILLIGNPDGLLSDSRLFIFCGGSVFSNMYGTSKLIMDSLAYKKVYSFFMNDLEKEIRMESPLSNFLRTNQLGIAFRSMIDFEGFRTFRENILENLRERIRTITLARDSVIPAAGILKTLGSHTRKNPKTVKVLDFPFPYTHENPFPLLNDSRREEVDRCFRQVFSEAAMFLA